tara:strand:- start:22428 stop:22751 length:324 start_codon:yes stop_codon:yes gene_type:complete
MSGYLKILDNEENKNLIVVSVEDKDNNNLTLDEKRLIAFDTIFYNFLKETKNKNISLKEFEKEKEKIKKRMKDSVMEKVSSVNEVDIILEYEKIVDGVLHFYYKKLY